MATKPKPKPKPKPKVKSKPKVKAKENVKEKVVKKNVNVIVEYNNPKTEDNENKYSEKIKLLLAKMKNQNADFDNRIGFSWKN